MSNIVPFAPIRLRRGHIHVGSLDITLGALVSVLGEGRRGVFPVRHRGRYIASLVADGPGRVVLARRYFPAASPD